MIVVLRVPICGLFIRAVLPAFLFILLGFYPSRVFVGSVFSWAMWPRVPVSRLCTRRFILDRILLIIVESAVRCVFHTHVIPGSGLPVSNE